MRLENQKKESVYRYDLDCTDEEAEKLRSMAIERFGKDQRAQLEYAIVSLLSDLVEGKDVEIESIVNKYIGGKNGTKNNNKRKNVDRSS